MVNCLLALAAGSALTREIFGNHSLASQRIFYALSATAIVVFAWGFIRRARLWRLGRAKKTISLLRAAAKHLLLDVLLQRRVLGRGWSSIGHVLLFAGFMGLLLATILLSIEHWLADLMGRAHGNPVFHKGIYFAVYEILSDAFGIALLAGCAIFAVRRWRRNGPTRCDVAIDHRWTDWWALGSLAFLGLTGYVVEGLRILYERSPQPGFSFVGFCFAELFRAIGLDEVNFASAHFVTWWLHSIVALMLIATIPYMRLLHSLAAALRVAVVPERLGAMSKIHAEEVEQTGLIGAAEIQHFDRIQLLELDACMACGRCEAACPAFEAGKPLSPRAVVQDLRGHLNLVGPFLLAANSPSVSAGESVPAESMHGDVISADTLWSCTACSACVDVCPVGVAPLNMIIDMRRNLIGEGQFRGAPAKALQNMGRLGNPWGLASKERVDWAAGLNVPLAADGAEFDVLYWVGCAASYDRRIQRIARSVVALLNAAKVRFAVLGIEERCTGESARRMGDEFLFQELAAQNIETLSQYGVRRGAKIILSHCPHCVNSFKQDYPQLGGDYEVVHHAEFLAKLIEAGRLPKPAPAVNGDGRITYHDPCYLARVGDVTEPPRQLVQIAIGPDHSNQFTEMPRNRRETSCCGAGGGRMWFDDPPSERVGTGRIQEVLETGAKTVAVGCPFCMVMLSDGIAARQADVQVKDVAEILADALMRPDGNEQESAPSFSPKT